MQLRKARLCLDCEELHDADRCPACASDAFVFLTRWVPSNERIVPRRAAPSPEPSSPEPPRRRPSLVKTGMLGLAMIAAGRWIWKATKPARPV